MQNVSINDDRLKPLESSRQNRNDAIANFDLLHLLYGHILRKYVLIMLNTAIRLLFPHLIRSDQQYIAMVLS